MKFHIRDAEPVDLLTKGADPIARIESGMADRVCPDWVGWKALGADHNSDRNQGNLYQTRLMAM